MGKFLEITFVVLSMVGAIVLANGSRKGYLIMMVAFPFALLFSIYYLHWGLLASYCFYFVVNLFGYIRWQEEV